MSIESRNHHFVPQCYLRGFSTPDSDNRQIGVIDIDGRRYFETNTKNVASRRDFNRVGVEGIAPDALETIVSQFEREVADAIGNVERERTLVGNDYSVIMYLLALLAVRNPSRRAQVDDLVERTARMRLAMVLATESRWQSAVEAMRRDGVDLGDEVSYETVREFFDSNQYEINLNREGHIGIEFRLVEDILPCFLDRRWTLVESTTETGPFITCDRPVYLTWKRPSRYSRPPGFGMRDTYVYFAISKQIAMVGDFEPGPLFVTGTAAVVGAINSNLIFNSVRQIYAPGLDFRFLDRNQDSLRGHEMLDYLRR